MGCICLSVGYLNRWQISSSGTSVLKLPGVNEVVLVAALHAAESSGLMPVAPETDEAAHLGSSARPCCSRCSDCVRWCCGSGQVRFGSLEPRSIGSQTLPD